MQPRTALGRAEPGWTPASVPVVAAPAAPVAARQQLALQDWRACHNHEDYAGGHLAYGRRTIPSGSVLLSMLGMVEVQAKRFGDRAGPLHGI